MNNAQLNNAMMQAQLHAQAGRLVEAESAYRNIIAAHPKFHPAYQELGLLAYAAGKLPWAADLFKTAIALDNNIALYHRNYGEICRRLGRFDEAIRSGTQACRLSPSDIDAHFNLGLACSDAKNFAGETQAYRRVLELMEPQLVSGQATPQMWNMRGNSLHRLGQFDEARRSYEHALKLQPDFPAALNSLGSLLINIGLTQEAHDCFARAVNIAPEFDMARLNLGMAQLKLGDWEQGWENYEARWTGSAESGNGTFSRPPCPLQQWDGRGETVKQGLLIITEQGFGDLFQFSRYLELAGKRFAKVGLVCPDSLTHLIMEWSFGEQVVVLKRMPVNYNTWHWQCPLMSLPRVFQTRLDTIPTSIPYLKVSKVAQAHWRDRLNEAAPGRFKIGVAWAGRRAHLYDAQRSLQFEQLLPLMKGHYDKQLTWVSLQKAGIDDPRPVSPEGVNWLDWTEELVDFADTAALVSNLDLIISIDSAMIHLAGGLARPVWMLNRFNSEWRWLEQREDSPWYPTLRIFNQPQPGDWASAFNTVQSALAKMPISHNAAS
jgi:tetratricopeptide (TPR) repeat protein